MRLIIPPINFLASKLEVLRSYGLKVNEPYEVSSLEELEAMMADLNDDVILTYNKNKNIFELTRPLILSED